MTHRDSKLRTFRALPVGWSHGEGVPVTEDAVRIAEHFIEIAMRLQITADVFPGVHGDCAVACYHGERSVEVIIPPGGGGRFGLHVEVGTGFHFDTLVQVDDASYAEVVRQIMQLTVQARAGLTGTQVLREIARNLFTDADIRMLDGWMW